MSWLARSIANSLKLDDDLDSDDQTSNSDEAPANPGGVKEDISELTKSLTRQLWGVASFLAPPPDPPATQISDPNDSDETVIAGIRSDFAEIGGRFRTEISKLSTNKTVFGITKMASSFLQLGDEAETKARGSVGVTEEVLVFARNVALHPETWLDFPLPDDDDSDDFELSDVQQEHALTVERFAPTLAALRYELCPGHMSDNHFWKIYFVLVHPRLDKQAAELLSTPEIVEARAMLAHELQVRGKASPVTDSTGNEVIPKECSDSPKEQLLSVPPSGKANLVPIETYKAVSVPQAESADFETDKHPVTSTEVKVVDKAVIEEGPKHMSKHQDPIYGSSSKVYDQKFEDEADDWLKDEDSSEIVGVSGTSIPIENDEDVSFSDLEEDDDGEIPICFKKTTSGSDSSAKDSKDWVQLSGSSGGSDKEISSVENKPSGSNQVRSSNVEAKETNDWLDLDDIDAM